MSIIEVIKDDLVYGYDCSYDCRLLWLKLNDEKYEKVLEPITNKYKYWAQFGLNEEQINILFDWSESDFDKLYFFEACCEEDYGPDAFKVIMGPLAQLQKEWGTNQRLVTATNIIDSISYLRQGKITFSQIKDLLSLLACGYNLDKLLELDEFKLVDDTTILIDQVLDDNPKQTEEAKKNQKIVFWLVGQVMKLAKGKADANKVTMLIKEKLK